MRRQPPRIIKPGPRSKYTPEWIESEACIFKDWIEKHRKDKIFWLKEFAVMRGYPSDQLAKFSKVSRKFKLLMEYAKSIQEVKIVKGALSGQLHCSFSMFLLRAKFGYQDKQYINLGGQAGNPIETKQERPPSIDTEQLKDPDRAKQIAEILRTAGALDIDEKPMVIN